MASVQQSALEPLLAELNKDIFFREFSFATTVFKSDGGEELELADHVIWIDDFLIVFQAKQRGPIQEVTNEGERKWFKKTVLGDGTRQVRDTLKFLSTQPKILVSNQRGHQFDLSQLSASLVTKLVVYLPHADLPEDCLEVRWHVSKTAGPIHILSWSDYLEICETLVTPIEVGQFFQFREVTLALRGETALPSERAVLGQFISGDFDAEPSEDYTRYFEALRRNKDDFEISFLLHGIAERIEHPEPGLGEVDYYKILAAFAMLNRSTLYQVRKRITLCLQSINRNESRTPTRIIANDCGLVFCCVTREEVADLPTRIETVTWLAKYEQKLNKQIGVGFGKDGREIVIYWCLIESEWKRDEEIDAMLVQDNPFLPMQSVAAARYMFDEPDDDA